MKIKRGVIMGGLKLPMRNALVAANIVYRELGKELVITSALDGTHSAGSMHYYGYAIDIRTWYFKKGVAEVAVRLIKNTLGKDYFVLLESNHIHIHYIPATSDEFRE